MWHVSLTEHALRQLGEIDPGQRKIIERWILKHLEGCADPKATGKALVGSLRGYWRYRVGKYRLICELLDEELMILAIEVGLRSSIYKQNE